MNGRLLFLGTGASAGVPVVACECTVCHSQLSKNQRLRPSVLIHMRNKKLLIDAGPDFRLQALRSGIKHLDGILFTHAHYDHAAGLDDLRVLSYKNHQSIPTLLSSETLEKLKKHYDYIFDPALASGMLTTRLDLHLLPNLEGEIEFLGIKIKYLTYKQGETKVTGFRFGNLAYLSDIRTFSSHIFDQLEGVQILILSALRYTTSILHLSVDEAIDFAEKIGARQTWLTHLSHDLDYEKTNVYLPSHIQLAYDGLEIEFVESL